MDYFRSDFDIIVFFVGRDENEWGRRDFLPQKLVFFTSSGAQRWAEREMGTQKKYGHSNDIDKTFENGMFFVTSFLLFSHEVCGF